MKLILRAFLIFNLLLSTVSVLAKEAKNDKFGTLTIESPNYKDRSEPLRKIEISSVGLTLTGMKGSLCFLPFEKIVAASSTRGCEGSEKKTKQDIIEEYKEIFGNAEQPHISCTLDSKHSPIGFNFTGRTKLAGEPVLMVRGLMLDRVGYENDYPIEPEEEDSAGTKALQSLGKGLLKVFFAY